MEIKINKLYTIELNDFERTQLCDELFDNMARLKDCIAVKELYCLLHTKNNTPYVML